MRCGASWRVFGRGKQVYYLIETLKGPGRVRYLFDAADVVDALRRLVAECRFASGAVLWQDGHRIARARVVGGQVEIVTE